MELSPARTVRRSLRWGTAVALLAVPVLVSAVAVSPAGAAGADGGPSGARRCAGFVPTIIGTSKADDLKGTDGRDVVLALDGDDTIDTGKGRDIVCAGDGFDLVKTGPGRDLVRGGRGDDNVVAGRGDDVVRGEAGIDSLFGGRGDDVLRGGAGFGLGIEGLIGGPGDDRLLGGPGLDSAQYFDAREGVRVNLRRGVATGRGRDTLRGVEGVVGSNHGDVLVGDDMGNGLFGQAGDDLIRAGSSGSLFRGTSDVMSGDEGDDTLVGGSGEDLVIFGRIPVGVSVDLGAGTATGQGADSLDGIEGVEGSVLNDELTGGPGRDLLAGSAGEDVIDGAAGRDTVIYSDLLRPVEVDLLAGRAVDADGAQDQLTDVENVWGTGAGDVLRGDGGVNHLLGRAGDDLLVGRAGADRLRGGPGVDTCQDPSAERVSCESGRRTSTGGRSSGWTIPWLYLQPARKGR